MQKRIHRICGLKLFFRKTTDVNTCVPNGTTHYEKQGFFSSSIEFCKHFHTVCKFTNPVLGLPTSVASMYPGLRTPSSTIPSRMPHCKTFESKEEKRSAILFHSANQHKECHHRVYNSNRLIGPAQFEKKNPENLCVHKAQRPALFKTPNNSKKMPAKC